MENNLYKTKLWKRILSVILAVIIGFGTFVTMTFANILLSDYVDLKSVLTVKAATFNPVPVYYRHGELVGLYRVNYSDKTKLQYKIGEDGEWTDYSVPFAIPAHKTTKVYARIGTTGKITYYNLSNTNEALGVYTESNTDFSFSYNGIDFGYTRIYNSADKNWFESIHSKVLVTNSRLEVTLPDGSKYPMIRKDASTYVDELTGKALTKTSSNYVFDDGTYKYYFAIKSVNSVAYLSAIEDNNGNRLNLSRTTNTEEVSISDGTGRKFSLSDYQAIDAPDGSDVKYYSQKEITDPNGNKLKYTTKQGKYIEIKDQAGVILGKYEYTNNTTDFTLLKSNDNKIEYYSNGRLKQITYKNGSWIKYTYTDSEKTYTTLTSSGQGTKIVYNDAFMPTEYTDEYGTTTSYTYDGHYRVLIKKTGDETTTYTYDTKGNILSWVTANEKDNTYFTYNSEGKVVRAQNGNNYSYYTYDSKGNNLIYATLKEDYEGEAPAFYTSLLTCFDTTEYTYDSKGRVVKKQSSLGSTYEYEYDTAGNVTKETLTEITDGETKTTVTTYTYDSFGNVLTTGREKDNSSYIYDKAGRTLLATENGKSTRTLYDDIGRKVQEIAPEDYDSTKDGLPTANTYADRNVGQRYFYNETTGNLDREINHLDVVTNYEYFDTGEKKSEAFDIYKYNYNVKGSLTDVFISGVNTVSYDYDDNNNLTLEAYANGDSIRYEYDENNNLVKQYHNEATAPYVTYSYNADDELTQKVNTDTGLKYVYGENNKVEVYKLADNSLVQSYTENVTEADEENNIEARTDVTEKHFDKEYKTVIGESSISYNTPTMSFEYSMDGDGDLAYQTINNCLSDVITTNVIYSEENNILINSYSNFGLDFLVKYDDKGNIIADEKNTYEYDEIGQLVSTIGNNSSSYIYDDRSNILTKIVENEITTFSYSNDGWRDQLTSVNGNALTYDANGNLISYDGKEYNWNYGKCLESITDEESTYNYTYDENGIRTSKTINGVTTNYDTLNGKILAQYNNDSNNHIYFQYYNDTPIGFELNDIQYFYISNINGDIVGITDADGKLLAKYFYDEWGKLSNIETAEENNEEQLSIAEINPLRYRGYYYDSETGMYYIQSRYYDPDLCRFISADDFENLSTNKKQLTNTYLYCFNNPIMYIDYNGEYPQLNEVPPPSSGYKAPKGGPVKQKVPKGSYKGKLGWKDSSGRYWVPDRTDHGGEHWDVVSKDGKSHENIYRDGHNRGDKDDSNNNEGSFLDKAIKLLIKLFVPSENIITVVFSLILIAVFLSTFIWFIPFLIPALA